MEELNRCAKWFIGGFLLSALLPVIPLVVTSVHELSATNQSAYAPVVNEVTTTKADRDVYAASRYVPLDPRQPIKPGQLPTAAELRNRRTIVVQELDF